MQWTYNDGGRSKYYKGHTGDCVCRAIAIANKMDYKDVYDLINKYSKEEESNSHARTGVSKDIVHKILTDLGWSWVPTMRFGVGCKTHLKEDELPKNQTIIARLSKHITCIVDSVIHDTYDCSRNSTRCVYGYYIKEPKRLSQ